MACLIECGATLTFHVFVFKSTQLEFEHCKHKKIDDLLLIRCYNCALLLCFVSFLVIASPTYAYLSAPLTAVAAAPLPLPPPPLPPSLEVGEASNLPPPPPPYSCDPSGSDLPQGKWVLRLG